jgi:magnesium-protoporphyrin O-methyltransferase
VTCCHCDLADKEFGEKTARRDLARYRKRGPNASTRKLINAVRGQPIANVTLLDIGSGIGVLAHELLDGPVVSATFVDESSAYQAVARKLADEHGNKDRCTFVAGDFVEVQPTLPEADLVTLDRVVCCYPDVDSLLGAVADTGASWCGLAYPRGRWHIRFGVAVINATLWLRRTHFRVFVHPEQRIWAVLEKQGFKVCHESGTFIWKTVLLERRSDAIKI